MADKEKCIKCGGETIEGFIIDRGDYNAKRQQVWVEGAPERSFWANGLKTADRKIFNVRAHRCAECRFLEFYTAEEADLDGFFN